MEEGIHPLLEPQRSWWSTLSPSARVAYAELPEPLPRVEVPDGNFDWVRESQRDRRLVTVWSLVCVAILVLVAWWQPFWGAEKALRPSAKSVDRSIIDEEETDGAKAHGMVWVGCFRTDDSYRLINRPDGSAGYDSVICARVCSDYIYMALQDGGHCLCGNTFADDPNQQQAFDGDCGEVCEGEDDLSPTRRCGTRDKNAVYRLSDGTNTAQSAAAATEAVLVGAWLFGKERSECYITRQEEGLRFSVPLPKGQTAFGTLMPAHGGWMVASLKSNGGENVGTIRLKLTREKAVLMTNFKYPGESDWGKDTVARKSEVPNKDSVLGEDVASDGKGPIRTWQVVTPHGLNVRSRMDTASEKLGTKWEGTVERGQQRGLWLELLDESGYMLIRHGAEVFLEPLTGAEKTTTITTTSTTTTSVTTAQAMDYVVVTINGLFVRAEMKPDSTVIGSKVEGSQVRGVAKGQWLRLTGEPGYMMIGHDGRSFLRKVGDLPSDVNYCDKDCDKKPELLRCLEWHPEGCEAIKDKDECLSSLDGRPVTSMNGRQVHGRPCAWCGGGPCSATKKLCEPFDPLATGAEIGDNDAYTVAKCPERWQTPLPPSLLCYVLIMPTGYEPDLVRAQISQSIGVFSCEGSIVFSNQSMSLGSITRTGRKVDATVLPMSLSVPYGGKWYTALNTPIFLRVWKAVLAHPEFDRHDWVVKADADCVFFPSRLRDVLSTQPMRSIPLLQQQGSDANCGTCSVPGRSGTTCRDRVRELQDQGVSCEAALRFAARPSPEDCGCQCSGSSCYSRPDSDGAMFLVNCRFGLHGPIEVLSRDAIRSFEARLPECQELRQRPWGEDKFLDRCMQHLDIRRVLTYELLDEVACGQKPVDCGSTTVAFHPFKDIQSYFDCWGFAHDHGTWPGTSLDKPAEETTGKLVIPLD